MLIIATPNNSTAL